MSRAMMTSTSRVRHRYRTPAAIICSEGSRGGRTLSASVGSMRNRNTTKIREPMAPQMYAAGRLTARTKPPPAGPTTDSSWLKLLFQVTALENSLRGMIWGRKAERAGRPSTPMTVPTISTA